MSDNDYVILDNNLLEEFLGAQVLEKDTDEYMKRMIKNGKFTDLFGDVNMTSKSAQLDYWDKLHKKILQIQDKDVMNDPNTMQKVQSLARRYQKISRKKSAWRDIINSDFDAYRAQLHKELDTRGDSNDAVSPVHADEGWAKKLREKHHVLFDEAVTILITELDNRKKGNNTKKASQKQPSRSQRSKTNSQKQIESQNPFRTSSSQQVVRRGPPRAPRRVPPRAPQQNLPKSGSKRQRNEGLYSITKQKRPTKRTKKLSGQNRTVADQSDQDVQMKANKGTTGKQEKRRDTKVSSQQMKANKGSKGKQEKPRDTKVSSQTKQSPRTYQAEIQCNKKQYQQSLKTTNQAHKVQIQRRERKAQSDRRDMIDKHVQDIAALKQKHENEMQNEKKSYEKKMEEIQNLLDRTNTQKGREIADLKTKYDDELRKLGDNLKREHQQSQEQYKLQLKDLDKTLRESQQQRQRFSKERDALSDQLEKTKKLLDKSGEDYAVIEARLKDNQSQREGLQKQLEDLSRAQQQQRTSNKRNYEELETKMADLKQERDAFAEIDGKLRKDLAAKTKDLNDLYPKMQKVKEQIDDHNAKIRDLNSENEALRTFMRESQQRHRQQTGKLKQQLENSKKESNLYRETQQGRKRDYARACEKLRQ